MNAGTFLYYLPGVRAFEVDSVTIVTRDLAKPFADVLRSKRDLLEEVFVSQLDEGPDGEPGTLVAAIPPNVQAGEWPVPEFAPERQTWKPERHDDRIALESTKRTESAYWFGIDRDTPPTPLGLARPSMLPHGYDRELGDGNVWCCPVIRRAMLVPMLPCVQAKHAGQLLRRPRPEFVDVWERSFLWAACEFSEAGWIGDYPEAERWDAAAECLGLNYRVGRHEINALGLFDDDTLDEVIGAALDVPYLDALKDSDDPRDRMALERIKLALQEAVG